MRGTTLTLVMTALAGVATIAATSAEPEPLTLVAAEQDLSAALAGESRPSGLLQRHEEVAVVLAAHRQREQLANADVHRSAGSASPTATAAHEPATRPVWDDIAACESNGDWTIDTGNGFYGGLQFEYRSWHWAGGGRFAEYPHHATKAQQIEIAEELLSIHPAGWGAWPACSRQVGLR